jgi:hypothetical protein
MQHEQWAQHEQQTDKNKGVNTGVERDLKRNAGGRPGYIDNPDSFCSCGSLTTTVM